ncbi:MAG TPA: M48 family metalloprotease [Candidatus Eisenbacteria bacterium]
MIRPRLLLLLLVAALAASCATNPVTGRREISLVSPERELQIGREGHDAIVAEYGLYDDSAVAAYVDSVGQSLARISHLPALKWTFSVLDDPTVNAFATPGGYVYITRGILAHLNSEAQLAGVLGHEIGHVTSRHTAQRITQQEIAGVGLSLAGALSEGFRRYGDAAQTALGVLMLKYSRDDENQADELGVEYSTKAGYDPREIPGTYVMLKRVGERAGQRLPAFLSTHPDPGDREERTRQLAGEAAAGKTGLLVRGRSYIQRLDHMVFGRDPRQGYFEGDRYYHPQMAFTLTLPSGWQRNDTHSSVTAAPSGSRAVMQLSLATDAGTFSAGGYARYLVRTGRVLDAAGAPESFDGLEAWMGRLEVKVSDGTFVSLATAFYRLGPDRMIQILGRGGEPGDEDEKAIVASMRSFRQLVDRSRLSASPDRVKVVKVPTGGRLEAVLPGFGRQALDGAGTSILNNLQLDEEVRPGELLKVVEPGQTH